MPTFHLSRQSPFQLLEPERLATPRLLIFRDRVEHNLQRMRGYLEQLAPATGYRHLCTHVKTNKSSLLTRWMVEAGVAYFKTTMREIDVAIAAGAREIFVAYPLVAHEASRLAQLISQHPETHFQVQIGAPAHAQILRAIALRENVTWNYFIDVDVGMHRTGVAPEHALQLFAEISGDSHFNFAGLHGYDGHIHFPEARARKIEAQAAMSNLAGLVRKFQSAKTKVPRLIAAGSPTFRFDLEILLAEVDSDTLVQVSPGTWILWDSNYENLSPGEFEIAAAILAQVIDVGQRNRVTLNLGHKRWAADQGPVQFFSVEGMRVVSFSEEHTVVEHPDSHKFEVGDYVLIAPRHVCPTVNLFEEFSLIDNEGKIERASCPVDGRNR